MKEQNFSTKEICFDSRRIGGFQQFPQLAADEEFTENPEKVKLLTLLKFQEEPKRLRNWIFQCHYRKNRASIRNINTGRNQKRSNRTFGELQCLCFETKDFMKILRFPSSIQV